MSNSSPNPLLSLARRVALVGTVVAAGAAGVVGAAEARHSASLTVGARVRPVARVDSLRAPAVLTLSEADLARGWVDLPEPIELELRANTPGGCDLGLELDTDLALAAEIGGLAPESIVVGDGGRFGPALTGPGRARLRLAIRLHLAPGARAGLHAFPVRLGAAMRP